MEPTLRDGDWLLVDPAAHAQRAPKMGDLVVARDPRAPERLIVKRVAGVAADGLRLAGDHPAHADDAGSIGPLDPTLVIGQPWLRYWPPRRIGRV